MARADAVARHQVQQGQLRVHADRGSSTFRHRQRNRGAADGVSISEPIRTEDDAQKL